MSAQVKPYSENQKKNIYDFSHTGGNKTTRAIAFIEHEITNGRPVIVIMQDYSTLDAAYLKRFSTTVLSRSLIVMGKTQERMCIHSDRYSKLYEFVSPINECNNCPKKTTCAYQAQKNQFKELLNSSSHGFVLLTTPRMLDHILHQCHSLKPTIIIDDVPLSQVITDEILDTEKNLKKLVKVCVDLACDKLSTIAQMLLDKSPSDVIVNYIREHKKAIDEEHFRSQKIINEMFTGGQEFATYDSVYGLCDAVSCDTMIEIFYDEHGIFGVLKIFSTRKNLQQYRIFYLNASSNYIDEYYIKQLEAEGLERIGKESDDNPQFTVYQLVDAKYPQSSITKSSAIVRKVSATAKHFITILTDLGMKIPFFTHDASYTTAFNPDRDFQQTPHEFVKFRGSKTKGTNEFLDVPISVIVGTPNLPASYFMHPAFKDVKKTDSEIITDIEKRNAEIKAKVYVHPVYPVPNNISERCAVEHLIQVIGRTLRIDNNHPERKKFVILFSFLENQNLFEKECKRQNGANVVLFKYDKRKEQEQFFKTIDNALPSVFTPYIKEKVFEKLDEELARGACVKLGEFSKERADECHKLVSYKTIERNITDAYDIELKPLGAKGMDIRIVVKKNVSS